MSALFLMTAMQNKGKLLLEEISIYQKVKNQVTDWNKLSASQI